MNIIDLSQLLYGDMPVYPGAKQPQFQQLTSVKEQGFRVANVTMNYHVGTHMDAAAHMLENGETLDNYPVSQFAGKGTAIDLTSLRSDQIGLRDLKMQEGLIREADFVLLYTGWSQYWGQDSYTGKYPCLTEEAAHWLAGFSLKGIGVDTISVDPIASESFAIHRILLEKNLVIVENLTNLGQLPGLDFDFFSMPLWIEGADGSPVRAVALVR